MRQRIKYNQNWYVSSADVKVRVELYVYSPCGPSWPVLGWTFIHRISHCWLCNSFGRHI